MCNLGLFGIAEGIAAQNMLAHASAKVSADEGCIVGVRETERFNELREFIEARHRHHRCNGLAFF